MGLDNGGTGMLTKRRRTQRQADLEDAVADQENKADDASQQGCKGMEGARNDGRDLRAQESDQSVSQAREIKGGLTAPCGVAECLQAILLGCRKKVGSCTVLQTCASP